MTARQKGVRLARLTLLGAVVAALYWLLFHYEGRILEVTRHGGWSFVLPLLIAFLFSFAHGSFTGHFWDAMGIKAKKS
jgi:hypothetical protein